MSMKLALQVLEAQDGTGGEDGPQVSPLSLTTTPVELVVPVNIPAIFPRRPQVLQALCTQDWRYGVNSSLNGEGTQKGYMLAKANVLTEVPVSLLNQVYVATDSEDGYFYFNWAG